MPTHDRIIGDSRTVLETLDGPFLHSTVTSPPYWGLRDYQVDGQIGLEELDSYLDSLTAVFSQVLRLTVPGGALMVNLGDTWNNYSSIRKHGRDTKQAVYNGDPRRPFVTGYAEKEVLDIPAKLTERLRAAGWLHRDNLIWVKPSGRPSKSDRPANAWEWIGYFRKPSGGRRYREAYWDREPIPNNVLTFNPETRSNHEAPMPLRLAQALVAATTPVDGWVLDPFAGSWTTERAASGLGRNSLSIDLREHVDMAS